MFWDDCKNQQRLRSEEAHRAERHPAPKLLAGTRGVQGCTIQSLLTLPGSKILWCKGLGWRVGRGGGEIFFAQWSFCLAEDAVQSSLKVLARLRAFRWPTGGAVGCGKPPPCRASGLGGHGWGRGGEESAPNRVNHRFDWIAYHGKTVNQKTMRSWSSFFPPTAENVFDKQHLKHVRKETVCLPECDFLGSRISP